jgi:hypothetical protein
MSARVSTALIRKKAIRAAVHASMTFFRIAFFSCDHVNMVAFDAFIAQNNAPADAGALR